MTNIPVVVNGVTVSVSPNSTVLQACEVAGFGNDVPRFCYHKQLRVAGNCRRCLVEIEKSPKPQASCARPVSPNRVIYTNSPEVKKARESVMEFLLRNHPLDCPICDQGGECDLQDQARLYGSDRSRFSPLGVKRSVEDKDWGPLVKTVRTRCIQCTRCVRFASEIAGVPVVGTTGRGKETEIGRYAQKPFLSEISGNVVDLCPVGALTAGGANVPFTFRPWELRNVEGIDVTDSDLAPIWLQYRGNALRRILPREANTSSLKTEALTLTGEWITDKARYSPLDGSTVQRVTTPYVKNEISWCEVDWNEIHYILRTRPRDRPLADDKVAVRVIYGTAVDCITIESINEWVGKVRDNVSVRFETLSPTKPSSFPVEPESLVANETTKDPENILLVGYNPRLQGALFNTRRRQLFLQGTTVWNVGPAVDLTYQVKHVSLSAKKGLKLHKLLTAADGQATTTSIIGGDVLRRIDKDSVISMTPEPVKYRFTRANEIYSNSSKHYSIGCEADLQILVGLTEAEIDAAGYDVSDRLKAGDYNIVITSEGADWRKKANRILPVFNAIETSGIYKSSDGRYKVQAGVKSKSSDTQVEAQEIFTRILPTYEFFDPMDGDMAVKYFKENHRVQSKDYYWWKAIPELYELVNMNRAELSKRNGLPRYVSMVDHHLEGHAFAEASPTMARCSVTFAEHQTNFS